MYIQKTTKCKVAQSISKSTKNENTQKVQLSSKADMKVKVKTLKAIVHPTKYGKKLVSGLKLKFRFFQKSEHSSPAKYPTLGNEGSCFK